LHSFHDSTVLLDQSAIANLDKYSDELFIFDIASAMASYYFYG